MVVVVVLLAHEFEFNLFVLNYLKCAPNPMVRRLLLLFNRFDLNFKSFDFPLK